MARVSTVGGWSQSTDESFRAWAKEYIQTLLDAGLVRTDDSGQADLDTLTRASASGASNDTLPVILRFNDALQSTAPIFISIRWGRASTASTPSMSFQIGTATDGASNLTGQITEVVRPAPQESPGSGTDYQSRAVHREGFAAMIWKIGGAPSSNGVSFSFVVQRTVNNEGLPTGEGAILITPSDGSNGTNSQNIHSSFSLLNFGDPVVRSPTSTAWLGRVHGQITDSRVGLSPQAFLHWVMLPKQRPLVGTLGFLRGEVPMLAEVSLAMVGNAPRNYLCVGGELGLSLSASGYSDWAILWED